MNGFFLVTLDSLARGRRLAWRWRCLTRDRLAANRSHRRTRTALLCWVSTEVHSVGLRDYSRPRRSLEPGTGRLGSAARSAVAGRGLRSAAGGPRARRRLRARIRATLRGHRAVTRRVIRARSTMGAVGTVGTVGTHGGTTRRSLGSLEPRLNRTGRQASTRYNTLLGSIQANAERLMEC